MGKEMKKQIEEKKQSCKEIAKKYNLEVENRILIEKRFLNFVKKTKHFSSIAFSKIDQISKNMNKFKISKNNEIELKKQNCYHKNINKMISNLLNKNKKNNSTDKNRILLEFNNEFKNAKNELLEVQEYILKKAKQNKILENELKKLKLAFEKVKKKYENNKLQSIKLLDEI